MLNKACHQYLLQGRFVIPQNGYCPGVLRHAMNETPILYTPRTPAAGWKKLDRQTPYCTTSALVYDAQGRFCLMHRSPAVRSAKDCWSIPSGLHELGFTLAEQMCVELSEELNLNGRLESAVTLGHYENIAVCDGYHWLIAVLAIRVDSFDTLVNKEPDKHDAIKLVTPLELNAMLEDPEVSWAPQLREFLRPAVRRLNWTLLETYELCG